MKLAVTGTAGQLARALITRGPAQGISVTPVGRPALDLLLPETIGPALETAAPDIIVNAAAYTAVDAAETDDATAMAVNGDGAGSVAAVASMLGIPIIQLSTDYVFDGALDRPYREDDATGPINAYGRSKLAGERAVAAQTDNHVILRTSWVYGPAGKNFVTTMLRVARTRPRLTIVSDQIGCPTSASDLADTVFNIAMRLTRSDDETLRGVVHAVGGGETSWHGFAEAIFAEAHKAGYPDVAVEPIATANYPTPARRPPNSRLETNKLMERYGIALPGWREALPDIVMAILETDATQREDMR
ncbi:MAG: dTDP-4-dehydrorhamnose reductase [Pseudomonadota bacterium]